MSSTCIYHQLPPTHFSVCYATFRQTIVLAAQELCAVCNVALQNVQYTLFN